MKTGSGGSGKIKLSIHNIHVSVLESLISADPADPFSITIIFISIYLITFRDLYKISMILNISQYDKPYLNWYES